MKACKATHYSTEIYIGWSSKEDKPGERVLWITDGNSLGDFYGNSVAVDERELPRLIAALEKLLRK